MITRVKITNYRGIEALDVDPGPSGSVARGRCQSGKTSFLKAIRAALGAVDIGPDAIRKGADEAEILVDLDNVSVRRRITAKTSSLSVTKDEEFSVKAPQTYLTNLLGTSPLDPMDLLTLKPKERRQRILAALPVTVTVEQLRQWWPKCPDGFDVSGHGLEVIENLRGKVYDKRTGANKTAKEARADADRLASLAAEAVKNAPSAHVDIDGAERLYDAAKASHTALLARQQESQKAEARLTSSREKIEELREGAKHIHLFLPTHEITDADFAEQSNRVASAKMEVAQLEAALLEAKLVLSSAQKVLDEMTAESARTKNLLAEASAKSQQADQLESAIALATVAAVSAEDLDAASVAEVAGFAALVKARSEQAAAERAANAQAEAAQSAAKAQELEAEAARLGALVKALTDDAPRELLASCDGIPGLTLDGDEVKLDGVSLDGLCGAEQIRFVVQVAKRANAKTKILVVDGLERLDPEAYDEFIKSATSGGWQLLASRVDRGDIVIEAIGAQECAEAAE